MTYDLLLMNIFKIPRKIYSKIFPNPYNKKLPCLTNPDEVSDLIFNMLTDSKPCMIARYGATELACLRNYSGVRNGFPNLWKYIKGEANDWVWNKWVTEKMSLWSGFFPCTPTNLTNFGELMIKDSKELDILGSWLPWERIMMDTWQNVKLVNLITLEPWTAHRPWSRALRNKNVLIIHPFAELITQQYKKRELLFENKEILPEFNLLTIKAIQSLGGENSHFKDWFEALDYMKSEMDKLDYDICIIGCGAYGFPLAAHAKRRGKKAIHLGGALQLLFGIKGKRWQDPNYAINWNLPQNLYLDMLSNPHWVSPGLQYRPKCSEKVENNCYW